MSLIIIIIIAIGLSMDACSLALIYGTLNVKPKTHKLMSIIVGMFHFFMPIIGYQIGEVLLKVIKIDPNILVGIIFIILGIEMFLSIKEQAKVKILTGVVSIILFALTVSIDSFSVGIGFGISETNIIISCILFSIISGLFTYLGISLGKKLSTIFGNIAIIIGSTILIILGITYLT